MADAPPGFFDAVPPPPGYDDDTGAHVDADPSSSTNEESSHNLIGDLTRRVAEWKKLNASKFGVRKEFNQATNVSRNDLRPPEFLRAVIRRQGDMKDKKFRDERRLFLGGMKYMPLAISKFIENIPMPWEQARYVTAVYHVAGALTIIDDTPTVSEPLYTAQWGAAWNQIRYHKVMLAQQGAACRPIEFPYFEGTDPPLDYEDIMDRDCPDSLRSEHLDAEEDKHVIDWFYDGEPQDDMKLVQLVPNKKNRINRRRGQWYFTVEVMETLFRLSSQVVSEIRNQNCFFLWNLKSYYAAKAMHVRIPRAPRFEVRGQEQALIKEQEDEDWNEFNDLRRVIHRDDPARPKFSMLTERQIAFPFLYSRRSVEGVQLAPYHYPSDVVIPNENPELPTFRFDYETLYPMTAVPRQVDDRAVFANTLASSTDILYCDDTYCDPEVDLVMDGDFMPFLEELPLECDGGLTAAAIQLHFAPAPFNQFSGTMKRRVDVSIAESWYEIPADIITEQMEKANIELSADDKRSYTRLLKHHVKKHEQHEKDVGKGKTGSSVRQIDALLERGKFFQKTKLDWLEVGLQLVRQGRVMLTQLINMKGISFLHLDENFGLAPVRQITTKEIKKSRLGPSFHLLRALLRLTKYIVDIHVKFRLGLVDAYELACGLRHLFSKMGVATELYKHKYRAMRQINRAEDLERMISSHFANPSNGLTAGTGMGFWAPMWRVWVYYLRGMTPLLNRYLSNAIDRMFEGRNYKTKAKKITRQRIESDRDVNIKEEFRREVREVLMTSQRFNSVAETDSLVKKLDQCLNQAFKVWKSGKTWRDPQLPQVWHDKIAKYCKKRAEEYERYARAQREVIAHHLSVDKNAFQKNLGRLTRLKVMEEIERQRAFSAREDVLLDNADAVAIFTAVSNWLDTRGFKKIPFPRDKTIGPVTQHLLTLSLNRLRQKHNLNYRTRQDERTEADLIEKAHLEPRQRYEIILKHLHGKAHFEPVKMEFMDAFNHLYPVYAVNPEEKITDAFLDQYLWYQAMEKQRLFPDWVKPHDKEPLPILVHKWCDGVNSAANVWDTAAGGATVALEIDMRNDFFDNVNWVTLFPKLLELIMEKPLADYIVRRHDVKLMFKEMEYQHRKGLIRGFQFSGFIGQFWGLVLDILLTGTSRSLALAGRPSAPNRFMHFNSNPEQAANHPIRGYMRYNNKAYLLLRFTEAEADALRTQYIEQTKSNPEYAEMHKSIHGFKNFRQWPRDARMRLTSADVDLARAVVWEFQGRIPAALVDIRREHCKVSVYSKDNPNLLFDMCGFSVRMLPLCRTEQIIESENMWPLHHRETRQLTARAFIQVCPDHVDLIRDRIRRTLMMVGNSTFQNIAAKWNALVTEIVPFYREAIIETNGLQEILAYGEKKIMTRVMMALNSKMAKRFPEVMFYAPNSLGGLEMVSVGGSLIVAKNKGLANETTDGAHHFLSGLTNADGKSIPNLLQFYPPWYTEIEEDYKAQREFRERLNEAKVSGRRIQREDVEHILEKGIPRIQVFFSKNRERLLHDKGFRCRQEYQRYVLGKSEKNWWFNHDHDGKIDARLAKYHADVITALGNIEQILQHSLFQATGFPSWEGLTWDNSKSFENSKTHANITKAMRGGLTNIPNRRFALWWSPTINRSDVYVGTETQINFTGIKMNGKLETIKTTLTEIFQKGIWSRIHESLVNHMASKINADAAQLQIREVTKPATHHAKSYTFTNSEADFVLHSQDFDGWAISPHPYLITDSDKKGFTRTRRCVSKFWIDIQLKWGNVNNHNIAEYARDQFEKYSRDGKSIYPSPAGVVIAIDLAYNIFSAYGYWIPGLREYIHRLTTVAMKTNPVLDQLRGQLKLKMNLKAESATDKLLSTSNLSEIFGSTQRVWIVDDSHAYVTSSVITAEGSKRHRCENGAVFCFDPKSGALRYGVIHKSVLGAKKRKRKLALERAAVEVLEFLRGTPQAELPHEIIVTRKNFFSALKDVLVEFEHIKIRMTDLSLSITQIHRHPRLADLRVGATSTSGAHHILNAYDDWLEVFRSLSEPCFFLLLVILRGFHVSFENTWKKLEPDGDVKRGPRSFWPTYSLEEWKTINRRLVEMIIADHCLRTHRDPRTVTEQEKSNILLGKRYDTVENEQLDLAAIEEARREADDEEQQQQQTEHLQRVTVTNERGEVVHKIVKKKAVAQRVDDAAWRTFAIHCSRLKKAEQIDALVEGTVTSDSIHFPAELLNRMIQIGHDSVEVVMYVFGHPLSPDEPYKKRAVCVMVPPQKGDVNDCSTPSLLPIDSALLVDNELEFLGILRVGGGYEDLHSRDLAWLGVLLSSNSALRAQRTSTRKTALMLGLLRFNGAVFTLKVHSVTEAGAAWATQWTKENYAKVEMDAIDGITSDTPLVAPANAHIDDEFDGFFLIPRDVPWNSYFLGKNWRPFEREAFTVVVGIPDEFFAMKHHPEHFKSFVDEEGFAAEDVEDIDRMDDESEFVDAFEKERRQTMK